MDFYGVRIPTIITENVSIRCDGCGGGIEGTPWRVSILDIVSRETPPSWAESADLNPGPFQFHSDPDHVLAWMARRGWLFCRRSRIRELMRPVWLPPAAEGQPRRLGLCDGLHRDDHEFVEPAPPPSQAPSAGPDSATVAEARAVTTEEVESGAAEASTAQRAVGQADSKSPRR